MFVSAPFFIVVGRTTVCHRRCSGIDRTFPLVSLLSSVMVLVSSWRMNGKVDMMVATEVLVSKVMLFVRAGKFGSEILVVGGCNTVCLILFFATNRLCSVPEFSRQHHQLLLMGGLARVHVLFSSSQCQRRPNIRGLPPIILSNVASSLWLGCRACRGLRAWWGQSLLP